MKAINKTFTVLLFTGIYALYVLDRLILAVSTRTLSNFATWGELHLPEEKRDYTKVKTSFRRVATVIIAVVLYNLLIGCGRKDYYCDCTYINPVHGPQEETIMIEAINKGSASDYCQDGAGVFFVDFECELR
jgi:hypothetical protein